MLVGVQSVLQVGNLAEDRAVPLQQLDVRGGEVVEAPLVKVTCGVLVPKIKRPALRACRSKNSNHAPSCLFRLAYFSASVHSVIGR